MTSISRRLLCCAAVLPMLIGQAHAVGSTAGVSVSNTATVGYSVGGVAQPDVNSNTATFVVDMLVNLVVAESGGAATTVTPGSLAQISTFTLTNTSNAPLDFRLALAQAANNASIAFGGTDGADATNVHVYVDGNNNHTYDVANDTADFVDELAADASITVFVVADIPVGLANNTGLGITLTAIAATGASTGLGADLIASSGADVANVVDVVFGDAAGSGDSAGDGRYGARDAYHVSAATLLINKLARIISDPVNGTNSPRAVPNAVVEYCIAVQNSGSESASNIVVTDAVPAHTTFVSGSIRSAGTVSSGVCNGDGAVEDDNATGADESDPAGGSFLANTVRVTLPLIAVGETLTALFRTKLD